MTGYVCLSPCKHSLDSRLSQSRWRIDLVDYGASSVRLDKLKRVPRRAPRRVSARQTRVSAPRHLLYYDAAFV